MNNLAHREKGFQKQANLSFSANWVFYNIRFNFFTNKIAQSSVIHLNRLISRLSIIVRVNVVLNAIGLLLTVTERTFRQPEQWSSSESKWVVPGQLMVLKTFHSFNHFRFIFLFSFFRVITFLTWECSVASQWTKRTWSVGGLSFPTLTGEIILKRTIDWY